MDNDFLFRARIKDEQVRRINKIREQNRLLKRRKVKSVFAELGFRSLPRNLNLIKLRKYTAKQRRIFRKRYRRILLAMGIMTMPKISRGLLKLLSRAERILLAKIRMRKFWNVMEINRLLQRINNRNIALNNPGSSLIDLGIKPDLADISRHILHNPNNKELNTTNQSIDSFRSRIERSRRMARSMWNHEDSGNRNL